MGDMARWRIIFSMGVIFAWTVTPLVACLPSSTMTKAEMECCREMAGNCHMGVRNHPCCEKKINQTAPVAEVQQPHTLQIVFVAIAPSSQLSVAPAREAGSSRTTLGLPPPAPPNLNFILRI